MNADPRRRIIAVLVPLLAATALDVRGEVWIQQDEGYVLGFVNYETKDGPTFYACGGNFEKVGNRPVTPANLTCDEYYERLRELPPHPASAPLVIPEWHEKTPTANMPKPPGCAYCDGVPDSDEAIPIEPPSGREGSSNPVWVLGGVPPSGVRAEGVRTG